MEDLNMLAADCVVICCCCCCQCMILQILVFALLKLPSKLIKKSRDFAKRKLNRRRRRSEIESYIEEIVRIEEECRFRVEAERERGFVEEDAGEGDCMEEVERAMMEFYRKGEFAFGSFWGREAIVSTKNRNDEEEEDEDFVSNIGSNLGS
ncbi:hypothetical protein G2W53_019049 [Senna tora]|uniref:Transmembrane protein n=1 Tax=Senna tora TaxID=362788 RepID=A0A834WLN5_9FABA|nr:hypothetical protein G2W53_019049 [Senna tora]